MQFYFLNIISWLEGHQLPCLIRTVFHHDCPGCGFQRSGIALLQGNVLQSLQIYPALIPMLLFFIFLLAERKYHFKYGSFITKIGIASIFIIILGSYIFKLYYQNRIL